MFLGFAASLLTFLTNFTVYRAEDDLFFSIFVTGDVFCTLYSAANALSRIPAPGRLFTTSAVVFAFTVSDIQKKKI